MKKGKKYTEVLSKIEKGKAYTKEEAVKLVKEIAKTQNVYVIGGAMLYQSMLPYYDDVYVNHVRASAEAEVFFPNLENNPDFTVLYADETIQDGDYETQLVVYARKE